MLLTCSNYEPIQIKLGVYPWPYRYDWYDAEALGYRYTPNASPDNFVGAFWVWVRLLARPHQGGRSVPFVR
jgi:hypothetical protein